MESTSRSLSPIRRGLSAAILPLLLLSGGCGSLPSVSEEDRASLLRVPVALVVVRGDLPERSQLGSAVVLSERELLLTPHQLAGDTGVCRVDGRLTSYRVLEIREGSSESGGWAVIRLDDPVATPAAIEFDFHANLPEGAELFVVGFPQREDVDLSVAGLDESKRILPGVLIRLSANHYADSAARARLDEFEFFRVEGLNQGTSGSPVLWRPSPGEPWRCVGICSGRYENVTSGVAYGMLRRPRELDLGRRVPDSNGTSPAPVPANRR